MGTHKTRLARRRRRSLVSEPSWREPDTWAPAARLLVGAVAFLFGVLGLLTAYAAVTLPDVNALGAMTGSIRVLDREGKLVAQIGHQGSPHLTVSLDQISPVMQQATLAAEDRTFYQEGAFDPPRLLKALVTDVVTASPNQGASTITQQLAKNAFLNSDKTAMRKLREALLAQQINARYSKPQILELYLNSIYYGDGAIGVEEAAESYFGVHASQLDLRQASMLAGLPAAPSYDNPFVNAQASFVRQHYVLGGMVDMGAITADQAAGVDPLAGAPGVDQLRNQAADLAALHVGAAPPFDQAPAFAEYVREELTRLFGPDSSAFNGTLTVTTTLDLNVQRAAQRAVTRGIAALGRGANNGALVMLDANTGGIEAMVGSANYADAAIAGQFNVTTGLRQEGSTFKPYVYATAFEEGRLRPTSTLLDTAQESGQLGGVHDFDNTFLGRLSASRALLLSRNVPAEEAMQIAGTDNVISLAHSMGITTPLASNLSTAIGTSSVSMLDQAAGYSAFANGGYRVAPHAVLKVVDSQGNLLLDNTSAGHGDQVLPSRVACTIDDILTGYPDTWGLSFDRPTAGKSGTTDNFRDAWYMAFTRDWVVATWAGHTDADGSSGSMQSVYGITMANYVTVPFVASLPSGGGGEFCNASPSPGQPENNPDNGEGD
ncbi:MAG TPA: transglycosylase domain-containing protein [Streptosporangiaceae bacterium]